VAGIAPEYLGLGAVGSNIQFRGDGDWFVHSSGYVFKPENGFTLMDLYNTSVYHMNRMTNDFFANIGSGLGGGMAGIGAGNLNQFANYVYPPELMFDGNHLHIVGADGAVIYRTRAYSGKSLPDGTFDYSLQRQKLDWIGPIPEGGYSINTDEIQRIGFGNRIKSVLGGEWPGGTASWGRQRVWISPMQGTNTYGRGNFTIHGGKIPGSGGCIDLTRNVNVFFRKLRRASSGFNIIPLRVNY